MKNKLILFSGWILWAITVTICIVFFIKGNTTQSDDNREALILSKSEKNLVLSEMRILLSVIQETLVFLSKDDYESAAKKSKEAGMDLVESLAAAEKSILVKLPIEFKKLGMGTHEKFDSFSKSVKMRKPLPVLLGELGELTTKCVACHKGYKIELEK